MRALLAAFVWAVSGWSGAVVEAAVMDAEAVATVTVDAPLYDTNIAADNGCDPSGCIGQYTRDSDAVSEGSRWACKPALGDAGSTCSITYGLASSLPLLGLNIALYKGDLRTRTIEIYVDDVMEMSWTSSGTTTDFENVALEVTGQTIELRGVLEDSEWLSIMEVEILVDDGVDEEESVPATSLGGVTVSADLYDEKLASDGGCDPNGCTPSNTQDGELADMSRWSCSPQLGDGADATCSISYTFVTVLELTELRLKLYKGDERQRTMEIYVDDALVTTWTSSGTTLDFESIDLSGQSGTVVTIVGVLANSEWLSIIETEIMALPVVGATAPPSPATTTPSPVEAPTSVEPVTPTGDLEPVGLLPLASTGGEDRFYAKDGDMSTSWTCTGDPLEEGESNYDCSMYFNMFSYRHIKQIRIAMPDGAGGPMEMRFRASFASDELGEEFVTHTGSADTFETFDFDYFTDGIFIAGVFTSSGQSISISEVEFVEEVQAGEISVTDFNTPYDNGDGLWTRSTTDTFEWYSDSDEAFERTLSFVLNSFAAMNSIELQFPVGDTYKFDLELYDQDEELGRTLTDFESTDAEGWQSFDLTELADGIYVTEVSIVMRGTGSGAPGFKLLNARFMGTPVDNPTDIFYVGSARVESWGSQRYPDFVGEGTGDQKAIMGAICAVKKASFDGVDCVGGDDTATGTVMMNFGEWFVDGNIFMKSGVLLDARYSIDDSPYTTDIKLEEGAAGKTDIAAIVVMDGISNAWIESLWIDGLYDLENSGDTAAVTGLGSVGVSIVGSQNITLEDTEVKYIDGDAVVVRDSNIVNIDAGSYDEEYLPWDISQSRGTGLVVESSDSVWIRRYTLFDNGVAGIHVVGSNNFTFEATIANECWGTSCVLEGEGNVGSVDGQQPIEVIVEGSTLVKFQDMKVQSVNDPVMSISTSTGVVFDNCGFSNVGSGTCVIQTDATSDVTTGDDPELMLDGTCYIKV